jgi:integrase
VEALCKTAELPQIVTQALRGTHATIATEAAATSHAVMAALGHTSFTVTQRHYLASGATERAAAKRVADRIPIARTESRVIGSGKSDPTESTDTA